MKLAYRLAEFVWPHEPFTGEFVDIGPECFAGIDHRGTTICWRGEMYVPIKPKLRVRLHNWLNSRGDR